MVVCDKPPPPPYSPPLHSCVPFSTCILRVLVGVQMDTLPNNLTGIHARYPGRKATIPLQWLRVMG